jgi:hypothetical protein
VPALAAFAPSAAPVRAAAESEAAISELYRPRLQIAPLQSRPLFWDLEIRMLRIFEFDLRRVIGHTRAYGYNASPVFQEQME